MSALGFGRRSAQAPEYGAGQRRSSSDYMDRLVDMIPADVVGGYVAVAASLKDAPSNSASHWICGAVFMTLTPILVLAGFAREFQQLNSRSPRVTDMPWKRTTLCMIAFACWVFALPAGPAASSVGDMTWVRAMVLVASALILPLFDQLLQRSDDPKGVD